MIPPKVLVCPGWWNQGGRVGEQSKFPFTQSLWNSLNIPNVVINTCHLLLPQILKPSYYQITHYFCTVASGTTS